MKIMHDSRTIPLNIVRELSANRLCYYFGFVACWFGSSVLTFGLACVGLLLKSSFKFSVWVGLKYNNIANFLMCSSTGRKLLLFV